MNSCRSGPPELAGGVWRLIGQGWAGLGLGSLDMKATDIQGLNPLNSCGSGPSEMGWVGWVGLAADWAELAGLALGCLGQPALDVQGRKPLILLLNWRLRGSGG